MITDRVQEVLGQRLNVVILPATAPDNRTFGWPPECIARWPEVRIHQVRYPTEVWYNEPVRREAMAQIRQLGVGPVVLIGFSKSGLGAWNIARTIPKLVAATIIFDAPVARPQRPPWNAAPFYPDDQAWQRDLPLGSIQEYRGAMGESQPLVLISGQIFHAEMCEFSHALTAAAVHHTFLPRPGLIHHWNSGWLELGLSHVLHHKDQSNTPP